MYNNYPYPNYYNQAQATNPQTSEVPEGYTTVTNENGDRFVVPFILGGITGSLLTAPFYRPYPVPFYYYRPFPRRYYW